MEAVARDRALFGVAAVLFFVSAAVTVAWCASMASMPGMDMPGGWTMSMAWMRMPGDSWPGAAATFLGMWAVMMVAMMLPVFAPMLARYRASVDFADPAQRRRLSGLVALAYFSVWTLLGAALYPLGLLLAEAAMHSSALSRAAPLAFAATLAFAGVLQFTPWKARLIECCRERPETCCAPPPGARTAWRHGASLGWKCVQCCAGLTASLLVLGVMDPSAMSLVTGLVALERLAPAGERWSRWIGGALVAYGVCLACSN